MYHICTVPLPSLPFVDFYSINSINASLCLASLARVSAGSRESVFEAVDKPALRALPKTRYAYAEYVTRRVPDNYHVEYRGFYYSVPYALYRQTVTLRVTENMLEILMMI